MSIAYGNFGLFWLHWRPLLLCLLLLPAAEVIGIGKIPQEDGFAFKVLLVFSEVYEALHLLQALDSLGKFRQMLLVEVGEIKVKF